ncbi:MAG: hypothetical protein RQ763_10060, partial [Sulfurimonas sp.]|uniref:hypothetical protein n=1 Tax=Sulfurimonas sp. TaxID=2022749 RepID=UPI0028CCC7B2
MRKITNLIAPILKNYRYRNKPDPFEQFQNLRKNETIPDSQKGNVLLLPIRVAPVSNLFEGIYGYALKLRGYKVHALMCNQLLDKCDNMTEKNDLPINCSLCQHEQKRFSKTFSIVSHEYQSLLDKQTIKDLYKIAHETKVDKIPLLEYDGVLLGHHIKSAVMRHSLSSNIDIKKDEDLLREYAFSTLVSYESTKRLLLEIQPKFVLSSHGVYSTWGGALEACKRLKVDVMVWGRGYVGGNIVVARNQSYLYERAIEPTKYWENSLLNTEQKDKLKNYLLAKRNPKSAVDHVNYYNGLKSSKVENIYETLGLKENRIKFALFPNIPWDGTTFSSSATFPTMELFFEKTINWFKNHPEYDLIIRAHPAELKNKGLETIKDLIDSIFPELPSNVYFLKPDHEVSSYEVEEISDVCLMYASTMALEIAYFGRPVIQAGQSNVSNKGFIFEPKSIKEYESLLDKASKKELHMTDDMKERVEKYAYH